MQEQLMSQARNSEVTHLIASKPHKSDSKSKKER
jgi:hypothetical protein